MDPRFIAFDEFHLHEIPIIPSHPPSTNRHYVCTITKKPTNVDQKKTSAVQYLFICLFVCSFLLSFIHTFSQRGSGRIVYHYYFTSRRQDRLHYHCCFFGIGIRGGLVCSPVSFLIKSIIYNAQHKIKYIKVPYLAPYFKSVPLVSVLICVFVVLGFFLLFIC